MPKILTHTKTFKCNFLLAFVYVISLHSVVSQTKTEKFNEKFSISPATIVQLDAIYTNIIFTSWNKNEIALKAYLDSPKLSDTLKAAQLKAWDLQVSLSDTLVFISSKAKPVIRKIATQYSFSGDASRDNISQVMRLVLAPMLQNLKNNPLPESLRQQLTHLKFDFAAYNQLGETYLKIWEHRFAKNLDEQSTTKLQKWAKSATNNLIQLPKVKQNEVVSVSQQPTELKETYQFNLVQTISVPEKVKVNKVLEVFVPKGSNLQFKTRYGSIDVSNELSNVQATMQYSPFKAEKISGKNTSLSISFAPVKINNWNNGQLALEYVKQSEIDNVDNINLLSNSSKTQINYIGKSAKIESMFGVLNVLKFGKNFTTLRLLSNNSDLAFTTPETSFNFAYNGNRSRIQVPPNKLTLKAIESYGNQMLNGYSGSRNTDNEIQMSVTNTNVLLR